MANIIERLEALGGDEDVPGRPWVVVADGEPQHWGIWGTEAGEVALGIGHPNSPELELAIAAVNALPDLLKLARAAERIARRKDDYTNDFAVLQEAVERLFREDSSRA